MPYTKNKLKMVIKISRKKARLWYRKVYNEMVKPKPLVKYINRTSENLTFIPRYEVILPEEDYTNRTTF